jgi:hypothetical protein
MLSQKKFPKHQHVNQKNDSISLAFGKKTLSKTDVRIAQLIKETEDKLSTSIGIKI